MSDEKIQVVMSRSAFLLYNRDYIDIGQSLVDQGYVDLTEVAEGRILNEHQIKNWDEIKHTLDKDCLVNPRSTILADGDMDSCEVSFDWNKYEIIWEK